MAQIDWIKLSDQQPKDGQQCLTFLPNDGDEGGSIAFGIWDEGKWFEGDMFGRGEYTEEVTYWMTRPIFPAGIGRNHPPDRDCECANCVSDFADNPIAASDAAFMTKTDILHAQRFDQILMIGLQDMECQTQVFETKPGGDEGLFLVTTSDGRAYSVRFDKFF